MDIAIIGGALIAGAFAHWAMKAWEDQKITQPELKTIPSIIGMVIVVLIVAFGTPLLATPQMAFLAGYTIESVYKRVIRKANGG